jgi:NAD+ synthase
MSEDHSPGTVEAGSDSDGGPRTIFDSLRLDAEAESTRIATWIRATLREDLHRRGLVVAISGGVDSAVCAALAVRAVGAGRVFGLLMPERDSASESGSRGRAVAERLGIAHETVPISATLEALGCYAARDAAFARVFPGFTADWRCKIAIADPLGETFTTFKAIVETPQGQRLEKRMDQDAYLGVVAATNYKQRIRKTIEYYYADRLHYAVVGTPNRLEYALGFFVKNGDGSADLKPIAHLYKTQVYQLARHLDLPAAVVSASPTTDTYSLPQSQDEFYFALPHDQMDAALHAIDSGLPDTALMDALGVDARRAALIRRDVAMKKQAAAYLHAPPLTPDPPPARTDVAALR